MVGQERGLGSTQGLPTQVTVLCTSTWTRPGPAGLESVAASALVTTGKTTFLGCTLSLNDITGRGPDKSHVSVLSHHTSGGLEGICANSPLPASSPVSLPRPSLPPSLLSSSFSFSSHHNSAVKAGPSCGDCGSWAHTTALPTSGASRCNQNGRPCASPGLPPWETTHRTPQLPPPRRLSEKSRLPQGKATRAVLQTHVCRGAGQDVCFRCETKRERPGLGAEKPQLRPRRRSCLRSVGGNDAFRGAMTIFKFHNTIFECQPFIL